VTYAAKIARADAAIHWGAGALAIDRQIRAFDPVPGAFTAHAGEPVKVWKAQPAMTEGAGAPPGTIVAVGATGIDVACGDGVLSLTEVQPAGGRRMSAAAFAAGRRIGRGQRFDAVAQ
jgi:methionyl-tRNA formyltransferase